MIQLKNLCKTFAGDNATIEAVNDISLTIEDGEIHGIIGLSGAGKSTLIRCINFLEVPTSGQVIFDGKDLAKLSAKELREARRQMSMIFQGFNLLMQRNVISNVCFPMEVAKTGTKEQIQKRAMELLETVGLADKAKAYPSQLSGGQKQRVAIARALATNPKVLLCDEATSALDPTTTQSILALIKQINKEMGVTVVVITHEMKVIEQICDKVAVIDKGKIVEQGEVKDVFMHPKSDIARRLVMPQDERTDFNPGHDCLRLVFDGDSSFEPIISDMTMTCRALVNILQADTRVIDGKTYGQMLIQLPEDEAMQQRIKIYLEEKGVVYKEEALDGNN